MTRKLGARTVVLTLLVAMSVGCASNRATQRAHEAARLENWDAAVYYYLEALAKDPANVSNRVELQRARLRAAEQHFRLGMAFREAGELQRARSELELTTQLDPTHQYAEVELAKVRSELAVLAQEGGAAKLEAMKKAASEMKVKPPLLNPTSSEPISLSFPNPTNVKDVYKAIGAAFGFNVLFDPKLKDSRVALELKDVTAKRALETVMQAAGHFYKVLDEKSIIVVEDTPQNRRDYEDLVVKTFFLSNADVKDVNNMLRSLIDARRIAVNEQLNSIVIRDTADKVAIAERLINANDKSKAEVLVDVELLQLDSSKLRDIGMSLSAYSFPITMDPTSITGGADKTRIPLDRLGDITRSMWGLTVPSVTISLVKSSGEAETLAQPQLRITEGEKANLVIGDKVPIPTTTFNTSNTIGSNVVPITAFNYQDVGIKIEVEPRVHHNNEVTLKLQVEVSELGENVEVSAGQKQPKIGTRTINSVIRLKDGETSLLAGLLKYSKRSSTSGVPWLSEIPVLGGLFRSNNTDFKKTDLILTLTPHIVRYPDIREEDLAPIWVGTESRITIFGNAPRVQSAGGGGGPFGEEAPGIGEPPSPEESVEPSGGGGIHFGDEGGGEGGRRTRPPIKIPEGGAIPGRRPGTGKPEGVAPSQPEGETATLPGSDGLATVSFYPARLPVVVGGLGELTVTLEPGLAGAVAPVHLAYDPARLEVVRIEEGDVAVETGSTHVEAVHTPPLGWITVSWSGRATGAGTLLRLTVRPLAAGEVPVIFAGPIGATVGGSATVVALPVASGQGEVVSP